MASNISDEWFRTVHNETSHHVVLLNQPRKTERLDYKDFLPIPYSKVEIKTYLELLPVLLKDFKEKWRTHPSAKSTITRYRGQYNDERQITASVRTLVDTIDALENEEGILPDFHDFRWDGTYLTALADIWTRDQSVYAHEKWARFLPVWSFVTGQPFFEPPPKFKLPDAGMGGQFTTAAVKTQAQSFVIPNEAASARGSRDVFDGTFRLLDSGIERLTLEDCEASKHVEAVDALRNTVEHAFQSSRLEKLPFDDGEVGTDRPQDITPDETPALDSDPFHSIWGSVRGCQWSFGSAGFENVNAKDMVRCSLDDTLDQRTSKEGMACNAIFPLNSYAAPRRPIVTFSTLPRIPLGERPIADLASVCSSSGARVEYHELGRKRYT